MALIKDGTLLAPRQFDMGNSCQHASIEGTGLSDENSTLSKLGQPVWLDPD
jgi:hypothetical protein